MDIENWQELSEEKVYDGYRKVFRRAYKMPNGQTTDFDLIKGNSGACIFALTPENKIVIAKQFRPGPGQIMSELPGGIVDENEKPEETAARELLEETGYSAENIKLIGSYFPDAYYTGKRYICVGTNAKKISDQKLDPNEFVEAGEVSVEEFKKLLEENKLTDYAAGIAGLKFFNLL